MLRKTSAEMRSDPLFMRNTYPVSGPLGIPIVHRQEIDLDNVSLIACSDTKPNDNEINRRCGVHFFVDDYRFEDVYRHPDRTLNKFSQYAFLLTPDYSTYADMNPWRQIESVAHSHWCGAYWQSHGLKVVQTMSWSTPSLEDICLGYVERHAVVAVGMIGCKQSKTAFMRGYDAMLERVEPDAIICFGAPFEEMRGNLIVVDYQASRKAVH